MTIKERFSKNKGWWILRAVLGVLAIVTFVWSCSEGERFAVSQARSCITTTAEILFGRE